MQLSWRILSRWSTCLGGFCVRRGIVSAAVLHSLVVPLIAASSATAWQETPAGQGALSSAPEVREFHVGFDGKYKVGAWTPVRVIVEAEEATSVELELVAPDVDGAPAAFRDAAGGQAVEPGTSSHTRYVKFGRSGGPLTISLRVDGREGVSSKSSLGDAVPTGDELVVVAGDEIGLADVGQDKRRGAESQYFVHLSRPQELPDRWYGYEAVSLLILADSRGEFLRGVSKEQFAAIREWVLQGGRLLFAASGGGSQFADDSPWREFAPGAFRAVENSLRTSGLEIFAGASRPLNRTSGEEEAVRLQVARFSDLRGTVQAYEGRLPTDEPWVIRYPHGFGQVTVAAFDLGAPPISTWADRPKLVAKLLQETLEQSGQSSAPRQRSGERPAFDDLSGQLHASLDHFDGVRVFAFSGVAGLLILYALIIGPADYFLLKKLNKLEWTWITFPLAVAGFCGLAWILASQWKSPRLRLNQLDLVDIDLEQARLRGVSWTHLYSPRGEIFDLSLETKSLETKATDGAMDRSGGTAVGDNTAVGNNTAVGDNTSGAVLSWQGMAPRGSGRIAAAGGARPYEISWVLSPGAQGSGASAAPSVQDLPVQISATKSLVGRWWSEARFDNGWNLRVDKVGTLRGEITNPLDVELYDCRLFFGRLAYQIDGRLAPGDTVAIEDLADPRTLEWKLAGKKIIEHQDVSTPWDSTSNDTGRILDLIMFHEAAGGRAYTAMNSRFQGYLDLSRHLIEGRAILVGRSDVPSSQLLRSGKSLSENYDRRSAVFRIMAPVRSEQGEPGAERRADVSPMSDRSLALAP